jgi:ADP-ribose pyrophosphatase
MSPAEQPSFRKIGERTKLAGHFLRYVSATFVDPSGFTFEREFVRHPGAACMVPVEDDGETILMVRQYRGVLDRFVLELPAGKLDVPGEDPDKAARRELIEEIGRDCRKLSALGAFYNSPGFTDELTHCFLCESLVVVEHARQGVEETHMSIERVRFGEVESLFARGELTDAKSLIAIGLAKRLIETRQSLPTS